MSFEQWNAAIGKELREYMLTLRAWEKVFKKKHPDGEAEIRRAFDTLAVAPMKEWLLARAKSLMDEVMEEVCRRSEASVDLIRTKVLEERPFVFYEYTDAVDAKGREWIAMAQALASEKRLKHFLDFERLTHEFAAMLDALKPYDVHVSMGADHVLVIQTPAKEN